MYKDLIDQLIKKYGTTNEDLNDFLDLIGAYYLFRREEIENTSKNTEPKDRVTPTYDDIKRELELIRQLKDENNTELLNYINEYGLTFITGVDTLFYQFVIDIWYLYVNRAEFLLDSWYRAIWYYGYYQNKNKPLSDELLAQLNKVDKVKLTDDDIDNNGNLPIHKKTKLGYLLAEQIHKKDTMKKDLLDLVNNSDNVLNSRVVTNLTLTSDLDKMEELATRLYTHYLDIASLFNVIATYFNYQIDDTLKKYNEQPLNNDDIKDKVEHLKKYFLDFKDKEEKTESKTKKAKSQKKQTIISDITDDKDELKDKFLQATSKQLKQIDNTRGGIIRYQETETETKQQELNKLKETLKQTDDKALQKEIREKIKEKEQELKDAKQKREELLEEKETLQKHLTATQDILFNNPKTSKEYKNALRDKRNLNKQIQEINKSLNFSGWQLDILGRGNYLVDFNKRKKEAMTLTIEGLNRQLAKYTKEEQDLSDFLINKYLHNTNSNVIEFTLREYEDKKKRARPDKYVQDDIIAVRLLLREIWTYYTEDDKSYTFTEEHLFNKLTIEGKKVDLTKDDKNDYKLDTKITLEVTETLDKLLQDHNNYQYIQTIIDYLQLNNDNEYLAKRLIRYFNYMARVNARTIKDGVLTIKLKYIIDELQFYGLKHYNELDNVNYTYKKEYVDKIHKALMILEGDNKANKKFIEVLPIKKGYEPYKVFDDYNDELKGKSLDYVKEKWGNKEIMIKILDFNNDTIKQIGYNSKTATKKATKK